MTSPMRRSAASCCEVPPESSPSSAWSAPTVRSPSRRSSRIRTRAGCPRARKKAAFTSWIGWVLCGISESYILRRNKRRNPVAPALRTPEADQPTGRACEKGRKLGCRGSAALARACGGGRGCGADDVQGEREAHPRRRRAEAGRRHRRDGLVHRHVRREEER